MNKPRRANRDLIKAMNRNLILNTVRRQGPLSRTQLTEISGLSVGAVSQITNDLIQDNWILDMGAGDYTGGRRQILLRLNPTAGYVLGLKLMEQRVVCAVTDLETTVLHYTETSLSSDHSPQHVSAALCRLVEHTIVEAGISRKKVLGVGVGLAGVVDCPTGVVYYSPFFQWKNVALAQLIADQLGLPVYLENDVNTLTITEQLYGPGHEVSNFVVVTIGRGIGMGMVLNHQLYQGEQGGVGELGHITLDPNGPRCDCGKRGCLEALAADASVLDYVAQKNGTPVASLPAVIQAAEQGDVLAREALARSGHYLGLGLATVINVLSPSLIILSGEGVSAGEFRLQPMREAMQKYTFNGLLDHVRLEVKPTDDRTWARGAAGLVVGKVFESPLLGVS